MELIESLRTINSSFLFCSSVTVAGWGKNNYTGELENILQEVDVKVQSKEECRHSSLYETEQVHKRILCAAAPNKDACQVNILEIKTKLSSCI